ncbi:MAG: hypothetical protein LUB56_03275 [Coprobacillus sp.]|nr:hypothetical protein [Coprobacillus sp.]
MAFDYWESRPLHSANKYTLSSIGLKGVRKEITFTSRDKAEDRMYELISKKGVHVTKVIEDSVNSDKAYYLSNGATCYISASF